MPGMGPSRSTPRFPARMSCGQARELARRVLADCEAPPALVTDVLTVVSELVSNAIRHAGGVTGFHIHRRAGLIAIEVSDQSLRMPHLRPRSPNGHGHFGWRLVRTPSSSASTAAAKPSPHPFPRQPPDGRRRDRRPEIGAAPGDCCPQSALGPRPHPRTRYRRGLSRTLTRAAVYTRIHGAALTTHADVEHAEAVGIGARPKRTRRGTDGFPGAVCVPAVQRPHPPQVPLPHLLPNGSPQEPTELLSDPRETGRPAAGTPAGSPDRGARAQQSPAGMSSGPGAGSACVGHPSSAPPAPSHPAPRPAPQARRMSYIPPPASGTAGASTSGRAERDQPRAGAVGPTAARPRPSAAAWLPPDGGRPARSNTVGRTQVRPRIHLPAHPEKTQSRGTPTRRQPLARPAAPGAG